MTTLTNLFEYILLSTVIVMVFVGLTVGGSRKRVRQNAKHFEPTPEGNRSFSHFRKDFGPVIDHTNERVFPGTDDNTFNSSL